MVAEPCCRIAYSPLVVADDTTVSVHCAELNSFLSNSDIPLFRRQLRVPASAERSGSRHGRQHVYLPPPHPPSSLTDPTPAAGNLVVVVVWTAPHSVMLLPRPLEAHPPSHSHGKGRQVAYIRLAVTSPH